MPRSDLRECPRPRHPPGDYRVEHDRRRRRASRAMLWTLDNALWCARYHNLMHRYCDIIEIANRSNLSDSFCSGIIQPNNHALFKTPTYYIQELYANHAGRTPLEIQHSSNAGDNATLDTSATLSPTAKPCRSSPSTPPIRRRNGGSMFPHSSRRPMRSTFGSSATPRTLPSVTRRTRGASPSASALSGAKPRSPGTRWSTHFRHFP